MTLKFALRGANQGATKFLDDVIEQQRYGNAVVREGIDNLNRSFGLQQRQRREDAAAEAAKKFTLGRDESRRGHELEMLKMRLGADRERARNAADARRKERAAKLPDMGDAYRKSVEKRARMLQGEEANIRRLNAIMNIADPAERSKQREQYDREIFERAREMVLDDYDRLVQNPSSASGYRGVQEFMRQYGLMPEDFVGPPAPGGRSPAGQPPSPASRPQGQVGESGVSALDPSDPSVKGVLEKYAGPQQSMENPAALSQYARGADQVAMGDPNDPNRAPPGFDPASWKKLMAVASEKDEELTPEDKAYLESFNPSDMVGIRDGQMFEIGQGGNVDEEGRVDGNVLHRDVVPRLMQAVQALGPDLGDRFLRSLTSTYRAPNQRTASASGVQPSGRMTQAELGADNPYPVASEYGSLHRTGRALDYSASSFTPEENRAIVEAMKAAGARHGGAADPVHFQFDGGSPEVAPRAPAPASAPAAEMGPPRSPAPQAPPPSGGSVLPSAAGGAVGSVVDAVGSMLPRDIGASVPDVTPGQRAGLLVENLIRGAARGAGGAVRSVAPRDAPVGVQQMTPEQLAKHMLSREDLTKDKWRKDPPPDVSPGETPYVPYLVRAELLKSAPALEREAMSALIPIGDQAAAVSLRQLSPQAAEAISKAMARAGFEPVSDVDGTVIYRSPMARQGEREREAARLREQPVRAPGAR